jgi:hypothetical protein
VTTADDWPRVLTTLARVASGVSVAPSAMDRARVEVRRVMRDRGADTRIVTGPYNRSAEKWWRLLGGMS